MKLRLFAGFVVALGGMAFLQYEGLLGAVLLSFGFLLVSFLGLSLFSKDIVGWKTGRLDGKWIWEVIQTFGLNLVAIWLVSLVFHHMGESAGYMICGHMESGNWLLKAVLCGFILDISFWAGERAWIWMIIFGTVLFAMLGLPYILTEFLYISVSGMWTGQALLYCGTVALGNIVGANIRKILTPRNP